MSARSKPCSASAFAVSNPRPRLPPVMMARGRFSVADICQLSQELGSFACWRFPEARGRQRRLQNVPNLAVLGLGSHLFDERAADSLTHVRQYRTRSNRYVQKSQRSAQCRNQVRTLEQMIGSLKRCTSDTNQIQPQYQANG